MLFILPMSRGGWNMIHVTLDKSGNDNTARELSSPMCSLGCGRAHLMARKQLRIRGVS